MTFTLFSPLHLALLAAIVVSGAAIGVALRQRPALRILFLRTGAASLVILELIWYGYVLQRPFPVWPGVLPLHLCDITVWLTVVSMFTSRGRVRELAYYYGMAGTSLALIMPDIQGLRLSYPVVQFFISHGLVVTLLMVAVLSGEMRPGKGSLLRAVIVLHLYAAVLAMFNEIFGTNYMYLCSRPGGDSILDLLGVWPWYLLGADLIGMLLFVLLWLPFRRTSEEQ